ncbi:MAG: MFS transporter [Litoreibacter sp.]|uniref:MFS transporter n=1 Tax=Litoreibacter sp. TaxID=1969459 RepID=UPI0032992A85
MEDSTKRASWRDWMAIAALGIGSFAIVTTELAPIGLLSEIGNDLNTSPAQVGLIVTLYAWIAALSAWVSVTTLSKLPRRSLLITLMFILGLSAAASAIADQFKALMAARVIGAIAHGAFWAMIGTVGAQIVLPRKVGLATSIIFGGVSAASVLGVPLANLIGSSEGWRMAFAAVAFLSILVAAAIWHALPKLPGVEGVNFSSLTRIASNSRFRRIFTATFLAITVHFMAFTCIEHFLTTGTTVPSEAVAPMLFTFGAAGVAANFLTGAMIDKSLKGILIGVYFCQVVRSCFLRSREATSTQ